MQVIKYALAPTVRWANGKGETTELIGWNDSHPRDDTDVAMWRLSVARLIEPAAFSPLPDVHRFFLPVGGSVELTVNDQVRHVLDGQVTEFGGADRVALSGLDRSPLHAVNLMIRGDAVVGPRLTVSRVDNPLFPTCLAAVALRGAGTIAGFDVIHPGGAGVWPADLPVAMIHPNRG